MHASEAGRCMRHGIMHKHSASSHLLANARQWQHPGPVVCWDQHHLRLRLPRRPPQALIAIEGAAQQAVAVTAPEAASYHPVRRLMYVASCPGFEQQGLQHSQHNGVRPGNTHPQHAIYGQCTSIYTYRLRRTQGCSLAVPSREMLPMMWRPGPKWLGGVPCVLEVKSTG